MKQQLLIISIFLLLCIQVNSYSHAVQISEDSSSHLATSTPSFHRSPSQLKPVIDQMLQLPEARTLLSKVNQEGPVSIVMQNDPSGQFDAMWDGEARLIKVNPYRHQTPGSWICSILFELHNASTTKHMDQLFTQAEQNSLSKETWVEQMERMEHRNALSTCQLLEKGMSQHIYPKEAQWTIFRAFDDYYKFQQITEHSHWLANSYDSVNPYSKRAVFQGTIPGLSTLSADDKKDLQNYLVIKNNLENPNQQEVIKSTAWVKNECTVLEGCLLGKRKDGCFRSREKIRLLQLTFKGNHDVEALSNRLSRGHVRI